MQVIFGYYLQTLYRYRNWLAKKRWRGPVTLFLIFLGFFLLNFFRLHVYEIFSSPVVIFTAMPLVLLSFPFIFASGRATTVAIENKPRAPTESQLRDIAKRYDKNDDAP